MNEYVNCHKDSWLFWKINQEKLLSVLCQTLVVWFNSQSRSREQARGLENRCVSQKSFTTCWHHCSVTSHVLSGILIASKKITARYPSNMYIIVISCQVMFKLHPISCSSLNSPFASKAIKGNGESVRLRNYLECSVWLMAIGHARLPIENERIVTLMEQKQPLIGVIISQ